MKELEVQGSWRVEVPELSALALRFREDGHSVELLGVGDRSFSIFAGDSVANLASETGSASQWEGLAVDGAGCAFVLQEHAGHEREPSHVFVFAPDLRRRVCVIALVVGDGADWEEAWNEDKNARGEALVLLRDGHLLVAKQKDPIRFIEFGPRGDDAAGLGPARFLGSDESFEYPSEDGLVEYEPLASWGLARKDRDELRAVNDLTVFDDALFAISRKDHAIVELESRAGPEEDALEVERSWRVPADVKNPEGLAIADGRLAIVADDLSAEEDDGGANVFALGFLNGVSPAGSRATRR
jgi:hypothetical protein